MDPNLFVPEYSATYFIVATIVSIVGLIALWKIYKKAGEHGWATLIPFYGNYVFFKITWGNGWFFLLLMIPLVNIVVHIISIYKLAKVFGHGVPFTIGLLFFYPIFTLILGFGSSNKYLGVSK